MTTSKILQFGGTLPRVSPELLPVSAAQTARGPKLYSGDLIATPLPKVVAAAGRTGTIKTLYGLRDPDTDEVKWLTWAGEIDVATPAADELGEQRFYYTGDGRPRVSTYALATAGEAPYPVANGYYRLGLPLPTLRPLATPTAFTPATSASFARDSGGNVTLVTASPHNVKDGAPVTISGFAYREGTYERVDTTVTVTIEDHGLVTGTRIYLEFTSGAATTNAYTVTVTGTDTFTVTDTASGATSGDCRWDIRDLNVTTTVTVINDTTLTYFSPGAQVAATSNSNGKVELGGLVQARNYLYTWYTPWDEESIGSQPSRVKFVKEGQIVTLSNLPDEPPAGQYNIRGIRLYRTLAGTAETAEADFFRLATLWFPQTINTVAREDNVVTLTFDEPHQFVVGDRLKLLTALGGDFDVTDVKVTAVPDDLTVRYAQAGGDISPTATKGTVYYDSAESPDDPGRYWGYPGFTFVDDFNYRSLTDILESNEYDPPPAGLQGITITQSNIMAGFVGNDIYFSEPGKFHAWPQKYKISLEHDVVGMVALGGDLLVLTDGYPYIISGSDPAVLAVSRYSVNYPCLSKRSIVQTDIGVMYATHEGLALASFTGGVQIVTALAHSPDTWNATLDPTTITATFYDSMYFASHSDGAFFYRRSQDGSAPGDIVDYDITFSASWFDAKSGSLFYVTGTDGDIVQWDNPGQPRMEYTWKSKVFVAQKPFNMGAARVVADYVDISTSPVWGEYDVAWEDANITWSAVEPIEFRLFADKELVFETTRSDSEVFRLPSGYKTDTYEVEVSGTARVRAIHLGETPKSLERS